MIMAVIIVSNYINDTLEHFFVLWISERDVREEWLRDQVLFNPVQSVCVLHNLQSLPLILQGNIITMTTNIWS